MRHMYHTSWRRSRKRRLCLPASPSGRRSWRNLSGPARVIFEKAWRWLGDVLAPSKEKGMGERREGDPQLIVLGLVLSSKAVTAWPVVQPPQVGRWYPCLFMTHDKARSPALTRSESHTSPEHCNLPVFIELPLLLPKNNQDGELQEHGRHERRSGVSGSIENRTNLRLVYSSGAPGSSIFLD